MLTYPNISPDIAKFSLFGFPLQIRWYGFLYVLSFMLGYILYKYNLRAKGINLKKDQYDSILFHIMMGVILGGRFGYVLFYDFLSYLKNPLDIFAVWQGGMSFHGGALGVIIAVMIFSRKQQINFYRIADPAMSIVAIGLGIGRLGNFINAELFGKPTNLPWGMVFPDSGGVAVHPTQLYEMILEGIVLALICQYVFRKSRWQGLTFWVFIGVYGIFRFLIEFVRKPDDLEFYRTFGYIFGFMSIGQFLSFLMILAASYGIYLISRHYTIHGD